MDASIHNSAEKQKHHCAKNVWKFSEQLLDGEEESISIDPSFSAEEAFTYYSASSKDPSPEHFRVPPWMNEVSEPSLILTVVKYPRRKLCVSLERQGIALLLALLVRYQEGYYLSSAV